MAAAAAEAERFRSRRRCLAVGETVILTTRPVYPLLKHLLKVQGGVAE